MNLRLLFAMVPVTNEPLALITSWIARRWTINIVKTLTTSVENLETF